MPALLSASVAIDRGLVPNDVGGFWIVGGGHERNANDGIVSWRKRPLHNLRIKPAEVSASGSLGLVSLFLEVFETELNLITLQFDHAILCGAAAANPRFQLFQEGFEAIWIHLKTSDHRDGLAPFPSSRGLHPNDLFILGCRPC